jgi:hypothetical protein
LDNVTGSDQVGDPLQVPLAKSPYVTVPVGGNVETPPTTKESYADESVDSEPLHASPVPESPTTFVTLGVAVATENGAQLLVDPV